MTDRKEMKKNRENNHGRKMIFAVSAALLTALVAFTACGTPGAANPAGTGTQTQNIVSGGQNAENTASPGTKGVAGEYIGLEKAKEIAMAQAGITGTEFFDCDFDYENGLPVYEVELKSGGYEYDYEIHAVTGEVLKAERDIDDDYRPNSSRT